MEKWQLMFVSFTIGGFIFQMTLIIGAYLISKCLPKEKTDKELLESIYKQPSLPDYMIRNLKI